jgi:hypothetical protein
MKVEQPLSSTEVGKAIDALPSKFKVKSVESIQDMEVDQEFRKWCTVEGMVLWKRLYESGNVMNILMDSQDFDAKALRVMVPKMHDINDISDGDIVIVTGDWYMNRKFDKESMKMLETGEPVIAASGIVPINKVDREDLDYLAGFK